MSIKIGLAGNPNSGKTTLFNALTGSNQYVGNWPGVTVEKKAGALKDDKTIEIIDLPGIYSLSPYTLEEVVTRDFVLNESPDVIINIVDTTNLERNLYLTTQLLELDIPVVVALNMMDIITKNGDILNEQQLSARLGCPVVRISALRGEGFAELIQASKKVALTSPVQKRLTFSPSVEAALNEITTLFVAHETSSRFKAVKLFEKDTKMIIELDLDKAKQKELESVIELCEKAEEDDSDSILTNERYNAIESLLKGVLKKKNTSRITPSDKIDHIVTNKWLALPIFAGIMFLVYYISVSTVGAWVTDWTNDVLFGEIIPPAVEGFLESINTAPWLNSLILDGIIGGVGAVLGFVPQLLILFLFLSILEDCGYMARVAFIMDRLFRKFGLSGKSFIPLLIGTGCSVPGIMASRTIENEADRRMSIMTTSFIPCGAKLPIIALIAGALFNGAWWVAPSAYFLGILAVMISGIILKKTKRFISEDSPFIMELPAYHMPAAKNIFMHTWERGWSFIKKAGTVIFLSCGIIWFLSNFNFKLQMVDTDVSILATLGKCLAPIFAPLGFGTWEATVATFTGLIAKENVVGTLGVLYGFTEVAEDGAEIWGAMAANFTAISAYAFLMFNLLCAPCFAAIGAIQREMNDSKWTWYALGYQTLFAYSFALMFNQFMLFFTGQGITIWTFIAVALFITFIYLLVKKPMQVKSKSSQFATARI
jgi:ferrous iron transport protein B